MPVTKDCSSGCINILNSAGKEWVHLDSPCDARLYPGSACPPCAAPVMTVGIGCGELFSSTNLPYSVCVQLSAGCRNTLGAPECSAHHCETPSISCLSLLSAPPHLFASPSNVSVSVRDDWPSCDLLLMVNRPPRRQLHCDQVSWCADSCPAKCIAYLQEPHRLRGAAACVCMLSTQSALQPKLESQIFGKNATGARRRRPLPSTWCCRRRRRQPMPAVWPPARP